MPGLSYSRSSPYKEWANTHCAPLFYLSVVLICFFVPVFHWVMPALQVGAYDSLGVRLIFSLPAIVFCLWVWLHPKAKLCLLELQAIQIAAMMIGLVVVSGVAGFGPYYLAASLLGIVGASLTLQTRQQIFWTIALATTALLIFVGFFYQGSFQTPLYFYLSAFVITATLATVKVSAHEKEFALRLALKKAMDDLQIERAISYAKAEQAFLGELASSMAHEINTPLATLQGSLDLLQKTAHTKPTSEINSYIDRASTQVMRVKEILDNVLYFSGVHFLDEETEDGVQLTKLAVGLIGPFAIKHSVFLQLETSQDKIHIKCLGRDYAQALFQLIKNAIEAAAIAPSPRWVTVRTKFGSSIDGFSVRVIDSGNGIDASRRAKLFSPLEASSSKIGHLGLGLNTVKTLIERNDGVVKFLEAEKHTTFEISFKD